MTKVSETTVTLQPGESTKVKFVIVPIDLKTYNVSVDGLSGVLKVVTPPTPIDYSTVRTIAGTLTRVGFDGVKFMGQLLIATDMAIDSRGKDWGSILGTIEVFSNYPFAFEAGPLPGYGTPVPLVSAGRRVIASVGWVDWTPPAGAAIKIWTASKLTYYPDYPPSAYFFMFSKSGRYWTVSGNVPTFSVVAAIYEGNYQHVVQKVTGPLSNWYCPYIPGLATECWCHPNPNATWQYQYKKQAEIDNWQLVGSTV